MSSVLGSYFKNKIKSCLSVVLAGGILIAAPASSFAAPVIAVLETDNPCSNCVIRGTIPFPAGFIADNEQQERFGVIDSDGTVVPAQIDIVSRHPDSSVAIGELSARVTGNASQGESIGRFRVTPLATPVAKKPASTVIQRQLANLTNMADGVRAFMMKSNQFSFRTTDAFGKTYSCAPFTSGKSKIYKYGYTQTTVAMFCSMTPDAGYNAANHQELPRMMDIAVFMTTKTGSSVIELDVLYGNTSVKGQGQTNVYVGNIYFKSLEMILPHGPNANSQFSLVTNLPDPTHNPVPTVVGNHKIYEIVKPQANGKFYLAPALGMSVRRLAITTVGNEAEALADLDMRGVAFARAGTLNGDTLFSWENPQTANAGLGENIPNLNFIGNSVVKTKMATQEANYRTHIISGLTTGGVLPYTNNAMGDKMPQGYAYGGWTGGGEIDPVPNEAYIWAASTKGLLWNMHQVRGYLDRNNRFATVDGLPWSVDNSLVACTSNNNPTGFAQKAQFSIVDGTPTQLNQDDPYGINQASAFSHHVNKVVADGLKPSYETLYLTFKPIDYQHLVRFMSKIYPLIEAKNDSVAKFLLSGMGENIRATYTIFSRNATGCPSISGSMLGHFKYVAAKPGKGVSTGRAHADIMNTVAQSFKFGDTAWRSKSRMWLNTAADILTNAQVQCSGFIQAHVPPQGKGLPAPYNTSNYYSSQSIEEERLSHTMVAFLNHVFKGYDTGRETAINHAIDLHLNRLITAPYWNANSGTEAKMVLVYIASTDHGVCPNEIQTGMISGNGNYELPNSLLRGYDRTGNVAFLNAANQILTGSTVISGLQSKFTTSGAGSVAWEPYSATALDLEQKRLGY